MVVVSTTPSTSTGATTQKKNRRKLHKKRTASQNEDAEMNETETTQDQSAAPTENPAPTTSAENNGDEDEIMIDADNTTLPPASAAPVFPELPASAQRSTLKSETRRVPIPPHRMTPLKKEWVNIFGPLTEMLGLQVRMNVPRRSVEIRVRTETSVSPVRSLTA